MGIKGMTLQGEDYIINISLVPKDSNDDLLVVTEKGYAKRTNIKAFRQFKKQGGKGMYTIKINDEKGLVIAVKVVREEDEIVLISQNGIVIRVPVNEIRKTGRYTQGVKIMNLSPDDKVASLALVSNENVDLSDLS
jgi:DNA gyrase subunit A